MIQVIQNEQSLARFFFRGIGMLWSYLAYIRFSILLHLELEHLNRFLAKVWTSKHIKCISPPFT